MPSYNDLARLLAYLKDRKEPMVAVFDIGTKASRLLVGPKDVPTNEWDKSLFFNGSQLTNFGNYVSQKFGYVKPKNEGLAAIIEFLGRYAEALRRSGIANEDIAAVGTAVFRWIENKAEVLATIKAKTGIDLRILDGPNEATLSVFSVLMTCRFRRQAGAGVEFTDNDVILLLDQGGGSTEVSYCLPTDLSGGGFMSVDQLGTIALRNKFFKMTAAGDVDAGANESRISTQIKRIHDYVTSTVDEWAGYPELQGKRVTAYAMGSAITKCFPADNSYKVHNRELTVARMDELREEASARVLKILPEKYAELDESKQQVRTLYKHISQLDRRESEEADNDLGQLYGLPVYAKILKKFGQDRLFVCGYGLRYGVYAVLHHWKMPHFLGPQPA